MLLAYLDEIGEPGAFVSKTHDKFNTSAAFGYAGFIIPQERLRDFGSIFTKEKRTLFSTEFAAAANKGAWEVKGSQVFRSKTPQYAPQNIRVFKHLTSTLKRFGGKFFFYADQKPLGTPAQVKLDIEAVERNAMAEVLNRVCRAADTMDRNVLFMIDAIDEAQRVKRLPNMYGHIFSRSQERLEMLRAVEPPMHIDSEYSAAIQFADWVAAIVGRAIEYQLLRQSDCDWVGEELWDLKDRLFTKESKLHLLKERSIGDLHNWDILKRERPFVDSNTLVADPETAQQMELMFQKARSKKQ